MGLIRTYSFNVNATASSSLTQITSAALNCKHRVIRCNNLLNQPGMPTSGTSLESPYLQSADGPILVNIDTMTNVRNPNSFLAVRVVNSNTSNLRVQCWTEVLELD